ncbi:Protein transport protein Sec61 subunit beta [Linum perenne]
MGGRQRNEKLSLFSQSQSSTSSSSSRPGLPAPRGSAAAAVASEELHHLLLPPVDPGLKISPTVVLIISLCFIGFVTALHVFGKIYRSKLSPQGA